MPDNYLGRENWSPDGFVSEADARVQDFYTRTGSQPANSAYSYAFPYQGRCVADLTGNSFAYIPTEYEIGAAIALRNMMEVSGGAIPVQETDPQQNQILQNLYAQTAAFWEDLRAASGTVG